MYGLLKINTVNNIERYFQVSMQSLSASHQPISHLVTLDCFFYECINVRLCV